MSGEPKTILERVQIAETYEIMRRQQTGFKTVDQWEAEISRLQQELSDCKASLRAVEAEREAFEAKLLVANGFRAAAEAREKQVRAALTHVRSFFDSDSHEYADELALIDAALATKEGGE